MKAALIIIGNEILSGRTQDQNLSYLANWLNEIGIQLAEVRVIRDEEGVIIETVNYLRKTYSYVFTTGGIGPTHDDITAKSISKAFNLTYGYHTKAYKILEKYYGKAKFNIGRKKMSKMPIKASLILNPTSGAPGFIVGNVYCLPGVPSILKSMLGGLKYKIKGGKKIFSKSISIRTVESEIAQPLEKINRNFKKVDIGSYPFFKLGKIGVSIVIRSSDKKEIDVCYKEIVDFLKKEKINIIENK